MPGISLSMSSARYFWFFEATEAVEVIEASDLITSGEVIEPTEVFRTTYALKIDKVMARIISF